MEANFLESNPGPVKAAMALQGLLEETYRLPLVPVQEKTRARLRELLQELGLLAKPRHAPACAQRGACPDAPPELQGRGPRDLARVPPRPEARGDPRRAANRAGGTGRP